MAKQLLGKEVAQAMDQKNIYRVQKLADGGVKVCVAIVRCGENPSDISYEKGAVKKAEAIGIEVKKIALPDTVTKQELLEVLDMLNADDNVHGVLMLRPLPVHLKSCQDEICNRLAVSKDIDCMTDASNAGVYEGKKIGFPPCTPQACMEILKYYEVPLKGRKAAVIGRSLIVGRPMAMMLMSENATVTICHTKTVDIPSIAKEADIVVTSAGQLGFFSKEYAAPGQIVLDVSINWDPSKKNGMGGIAGDCVFEDVEPIVASITPVPGGVGAVTTSVLIDHVVTAAERAASL